MARIYEAVGNLNLSAKYYKNVLLVCDVMRIKFKYRKFNLYGPL